MQTGQTVPYVGSRISLISKSAIRYVGTLYTIDTKASTVALKDVRSYGTEGRHRDAGQVQPSHRVYSYIIFRGPDIMDLQFLTDPADLQQHPSDVALQPTPNHTQPPSQPLPEADRQRKPLAGAEASTPVPASSSEAASASLPTHAPVATSGPIPSQPYRDVEIATSAAPSTSPLQAPSKLPPTRRPPTAPVVTPPETTRPVAMPMPMPRAWGPPPGRRHRTRRGASAPNHTNYAGRSAPAVPAEDFDFETMNRQFEKAVTLHGQSVQRRYDKEKSFFDQLVPEKEMRADRNAAQRRATDLETFGEAAVRRGRRSRGRPGYRGRGRRDRGRDRDRDRDRDRERQNENDRQRLPKIGT